MSAKKSRERKTLIRIARMETQGVLRHFDWPSAALDVHRRWKLRYEVFAYQHLGIPPTDHGSFLLRCEPEPENGEVRLRVDVDIDDGAGARHQLQADMAAQNDMFLTPVSWQVRSHMRGPNGAVIVETQMKEEGSIGGKQLHLELNGRPLQKPVPPGPLTSDYGLYAVIMGLAPKSERVDFALLEDYRAIKPGHLLVRDTDETLHFKGQTRTLRRYLQAGTGTMPAEYFVDDSTGVLLMANVGLGCCVYRPSAEDGQA